MSATPCRFYEFDDFRLDALKREVQKAGETLQLRPRVFDTLLYFVQNQGRVIEKDELMRAIWPDAIVEENNLNQNVSILRRALNTNRGENRYIVTVPGIGYRFTAQIKLVPDTAQPHSTTRATENTFAVLPFKPIVAESQDAALELGMADALITRLSNSKDIIVRPLSSVRRYGGLEQDPQVAGRELGVKSVLDGSIQRITERIRVTARLIKVEDGSSLWVGTFDEKFTDVFAVQDAISERVVRALALRLSVKEKKRLTKRHTENTAAYELYLKGRYYGSKLIPPEVRKGIQFFQQAIELDPTYALAYAGLADAYRSLPMTSDVPPEDAFPLARAAAVKALEIDELLADVHATLAFIKSWYDWDWDGAEREAKRALTLNPNSSEAHRAYALVLSTLGRQKEAIAEGALARELDPLALLTRTHESLFLYYDGRDDEAIEKLNKTLEIDPNFWIALLTMAKIYIRQKKYNEAIAELNKARNSSGGNTQTLSLIGYVKALSGDRTQALAVLAELKALSTQRYVPPYNIALVYNGLGEDDKTFNWLQRAYQERDILLSAFITVDPNWQRLRNTQHFADMIKSMNFA